MSAFVAFGKAQVCAVGKVGHEMYERRRGLNEQRDSVWSGKNNQKLNRVIFLLCHCFPMRVFQRERTILSLSALAEKFRIQLLDHDCISPL